MATPEEMEQLEHEIQELEAQLAKEEDEMQQLLHHISRSETGECQICLIYKFL